MVNIGIIGSRRRNTIKDFWDVYNRFKSLYFPGDIIVSGGCPQGGDRFAEIISYFGTTLTDLDSASIETYLNVKNFYSINTDLPSDMKIPIKIYYPDKSKLPAHPQRYHFAQINYERNTLIANNSDILIACVSEDRRGGTEDTIKKFLKHKTFNNLHLV